MVSAGRAGAWTLVIYLGLQRLGELRSASSNERRLKGAGAVEHGRAHYPVLVAFHAAFFAVLAAACVRGAALGPRSAPWLGLFAAAQGLRYWAVRSLGGRWTTRIWTVPGEKPVVAGPYRWLRHPIYAAVAGEVAALPLALGLPAAAAVFTAGDALLLSIRIRTENRAWSPG